MFNLCETGALYIFCVNRLAAILHMGRNGLSDVIHKVADMAPFWDTFSSPFHHRWLYSPIHNPILRFTSAVADSTHLVIPIPPTAVLREMLWMSKPSHHGHALVFNLNINWNAEVIGCSWWYPPRIYDSVIQTDMDKDMPWDFTGDRPDWCCGDPHYSTAKNFVTRIVGGDRQIPATAAVEDYNRHINQMRNLVERVIRDIKKYAFFQGLKRDGHSYDYDFITKMFIFSCHVHNMQKRYSAMGHSAAYR